MEVIISRSNKEISVVKQDQKRKEGILDSLPREEIQTDSYLLLFVYEQFRPRTRAEDYNPNTR